MKTALATINFGVVKYVQKLACNGKVESCSLGNTSILKSTFKMRKIMIRHTNGIILAWDREPCGLL